MLKVASGINAHAGHELSHLGIHSCWLSKQVTGVNGTFPGPSNPWMPHRTHLPLMPFADFISSCLGVLAQGPTTFCPPLHILLHFNHKALCLGRLLQGVSVGYPCSSPGARGPCTLAVHPCTRGIAHQGFRPPSRALRSLSAAFLFSDGVVLPQLNGRKSH